MRAADARPRSIKRSGCDGYVRITVGTREQMRAATAALKDAVTALDREKGTMKTAKKAGAK